MPLFMHIGCLILTTCERVKRCLMHVCHTSRLHVCVRVVLTEACVSQVSPPLALTGRHLARPQAQSRRQHRCAAYRMLLCSVCILIAYEFIMNGGAFTCPNALRKGVCADTLLQPQMKKKRSVASLEKRDLRSTNKYVLTQQQQDSDGGVSSQLVKVRPPHARFLVMSPLTASRNWQNEMLRLIACFSLRSIWCAPW